MKVILSLCLFLTALHVRADGPPISADGKITEPYKAFALNAEQKKTLRSSRVITLTPEQARRERLQDPERRLFILTANYYDCTCGLTYGIWFHPDSVAIFGQEYPAMDTLPAGGIMPGRAMLQITSMQGPEQVKLQLHITADGKLFYQKQEVGTQTDSITELLYRLSEASANTDSSGAFADPSPITLYIPPLIGNPRRDQVLRLFYRLHQLNMRTPGVRWIYE